MKYCEKCGNPLMDGDLFCGSCGTRVTTEESDAPAVKETEKDYFNPYANDYSGFETEKNPGQSEPAEPAEEPESSFEGQACEQPFVQPSVQTPDQPSDSTDNNASSGSQKKNTISIGIDLRKAKVPLIIAGVVAVLLIAALIIAGVVSDKMKKAPIELNLADYISDTVYTRTELASAQDTDESYDQYSDYSDYDDASDSNTLYYNSYDSGLLVDGYNGYGYIDSSCLPGVIDWDSLAKYVDEKLAKKSDGKHTLHYYDLLNTDSFTFSVDKADGLSNGDTVTVTVSGTLETITSDSVQINIVPVTKEYKVDRLETVPVINPFDYISCATYGPNGYASVSYLIDPNLNKEIEGLDGFTVTRYSDNTIAIEMNGYIVNKIRFYNDSYSNYSNGDQATIYCESEVYGFEEEYHVYIAQYEKEYTISGLGEYLTSTDTLSQDDISAFISDSESVVQSSINNDYRSDFVYKGTYFYDKKDKTSSYSSNPTNGIFVVYSYLYENWYGEKTAMYAYVQYGEVIASDGKLFGTAHNYYGYYDYGFESAEEIAERMSDGGYYIVKQID